jgi:5-methylcytosine-specific restriction endonuclease McrA
MATEDNKIVSRKQAIFLRMDRYFTGKPCVRGHIDFRHTEGRYCIKCAGEYYRSDPQKYKDRAKRWHAANWDRVKERYNKATSIRQKNNLERAYVHGRLYRARKRGSIGHHTVADILDIFAIQKEKCAYCRAKLTLRTKQVDHIIPVSKGGSDAKTNLQILCKPCNLRKASKDPLDYARECGKLI